MEENKTEVIEMTEEVGTEDGMEKKIDVEGLIGTGLIAVAAIGAFETGKFVVKKAKEPAKKLWGKFTGLFKKKSNEDEKSSEPDHEELTADVDEKAEEKKSKKSK